MRLTTGGQLAHLLKGKAGLPAAARLCDTAHGPNRRSPANPLRPRPSRVAVVGRGQHCDRTADEERGELVGHVSLATGSVWAV
jgi:hypothetical protein